MTASLKVRRPQTSTSAPLPHCFAASSAILCHLVNENPHEENSEDLAPGAFGKISFDIVLKSDYDAGFAVALSFYPLGIAANGDPTPIVDPEETDPAVQAEQEELLSELQEMLSGHGRPLLHRRDLLDMAGNLRTARA